MKRKLLLLALLSLLCCLCLASCGGECKEHLWDDGTTIGGGGCTEDERILFRCTACQETKEETVPAPGHNFVFVETIEATCTEDGSTVYSCTACSETSYESIASPGHTLSTEFSSDSYEHWLACSACSDRVNSEEHSFVDGYCECKESVLIFEAISEDGETVGYKLSGIRSGYASLITEVVVPDTYHGLPVTAVDFGNWGVKTALTKVTLGRNVQTVESYCFEGFTALKTVLGGEGVKRLASCAFSGCESLETFSFASTLTYIGDRAFYGCISLSSVVIPVGVTYIGDYAFYDCKSVGTLVYNAKDAEFYMEYGYNGASNPFTYLGADKAQVRVTVGAAVEVIPARLLYSVLRPVVSMESTVLKRIGSEAFRNYNLHFTEITLPETLETIGDCAFLGSRIEQVVIPAGVTRIEAYTFEDCEALKSLVIGEGVTDIGTGAFNNCTALEQITILGSLSEMSTEERENVDEDSLIFGNCGANGAGLSVTVGAAVEKIPSYFFYASDMMGLSTGLSSLTFAQNSACKEIGAYAFTDCGDLEQVLLPAGLESIGKGAFAETSVAAIAIPDSVISLGAYAFDSCLSLNLLSIGAGLSSLPESAFKGCYALTYLVLPNGIERIGSSCFYNTNISYLQIGTGLSEVDETAFPRKVREVINLSSFDYAQFHNEWYSSYAMPEILTSAEQSSMRIVASTLIDTAVGAQVVGYFGGTRTLTIPTKAQIASCGLTALTVAADAFESSGYEAVVISDAVSAIGETAFRYTHSMQTLVLDATAGLSVGASAFYNSALSEIELKNGAQIAVINEQAFRASNLESISLVNAVSIYDFAFADCPKLQSVSFASLQRVRDGVFEGCISLTSVDLPSSVNGIGERAFADCISLAAFEIPSGLAPQNLSDSAFAGCLSLEAFTVESGASNFRAVDGVLYDYSYGTNLVLYPAGREAAVFEMPAGVTTIHSYAFRDAVYLQTVIFAEGVTSVPVGAFEDAQISLVVLPDSVTSIAESAFRDCKRLVRVILGANLSQVHERAFIGCDSLKEIYNPSSLDLSYLGNAVITDMSKASAYTVQGDYLFKTVEDTHFLIAYLGGSDALVLPASFNGESYAIATCAFANLPIRSVSIPAAVSAIGDGAFAECTLLSRVEITTAIAEVDVYAGIFYNAGKACGGMDVIFTDACTTVPAYLFHDTYAYIRTVTIGAGVQKLGAEAFAGCEGLETVYYNAIHATRASNSAYPFRDCYSKEVTFVIGDQVEYLGSGLLRNSGAHEISKKDFTVGRLVIGENTALENIPYDLTDHIFDIVFCGSEEKFVAAFDCFEGSHSMNEMLYHCTVYFVTEE